MAQKNTRSRIALYLSSAIPHIAKVVVGHVHRKDAVDLVERAGTPLMAKSKGTDAIGENRRIPGESRIGSGNRLGDDGVLRGSHEGRKKEHHDHHEHTKAG